MKSDEEKRFLEAFEDNRDSLFRHAFFRISNRDRAFDLTQDTFLKTWDYVSKGGVIDNYKNFLYRTLRNLIIDEYRKKSSFSLDAMLEDESTAATVEAMMSEGSIWEVEEAIDEAEVLLTIRKHIEELPVLYREALTLRFVDGFSIKEIAQMIETRENVVSVRIHRGVAKLRELCNL